MIDQNSFFEMEDVPDVSDHSLWVERYRPKTVSDLIGSAAIKETLQAWINTKDIPHTLLFSPPGTGKTSIGKILIKHIPCDSLIINASDENGVDSIRNKVQDFCMTMGSQPLKIMFLDECLDENTLVLVLRGGEECTISIKNLDPTNDLVKSFNIEKNRIEWRPFDLVFQGEKETYEIEFENGEIIICTDTHKWYVSDEDNNIIRKKTSDMIKDGNTYILTTECDSITPEPQ